MSDDNGELLANAESRDRSAWHADYLPIRVDGSRR